MPGAERDGGKDCRMGIGGNGGAGAYWGGMGGDKRGDKKEDKGGDKGGNKRREKRQEKRQARRQAMESLGTGARGGNGCKRAKVLFYIFFMKANNSQSSVFTKMRRSGFYRSYA